MTSDQRQREDGGKQEAVPLGILREGEHLSCSASLKRLAQSIPGAPVLHREGANAAPFTEARR